MSWAILLTVSAVRLHVIVCRMHACMFYYDLPDCKYPAAAAIVVVVPPFKTIKFRLTVCLPI